MIVTNKEIRELRDKYNSMLDEVLIIESKMEEMQEQKKEIQKTMRELDYDINLKAGIFNGENTEKREELRS